MQSLSAIQHARKMLDTDPKVNEQNGQLQLNSLGDSFSKIKHEYFFKNSSDLFVSEMIFTLNKVIHSL